MQEGIKKDLRDLTVFLDRPKNNVK